MFTVLILNQKSLDSFYEHLPLFSEYVQDGQIQTCLWDESKKTAAEALGELHALTDHQKHWRAIIVRYEDESEMACLPVRPDNPYDFSDAAGNSPEWTSIPLVRLCRQLARPLEAGSVERVSVYEADGRVAGGYEGIYPESIVLVSVRYTDGLLALNKGSEQLARTSFAIENGYPSLCRFAVVDRCRQGARKKMEDDFDFWSIVMILAANSIDSSLMQAYRLHVLSVVRNPERLSKLFSRKDQQLSAIARRMAHILEHASVRLEKREGRYPDYAVKIEDIQSDDFRKEITILPEIYLHVPAVPSQQAEAFVHNARQNRAALIERYENAPADLYRMIPALHKRPGYEDKDVDILSVLQLEKLEEEIRQLNLQIIDEMAALPKIRFDKDEAFEDALQTVQDLMESRMSRKTALLGTLVSAGLSESACLPGYVYLLQRVTENWQTLAGLSLLLPSVPAAATAFVLWRQKKRIRQAIRAWNDLALVSLEEIDAYRRQYRLYLSDVLSYRRARSYYEISRKKVQAQIDQQKAMEEQLDQILAWQKKLRNWGDALHVTFSLEQAAFDPLLANELRQIALLQSGQLMSEEMKKMEFTLEPGFRGLLEVDTLGRRIPSPFSFVEHLCIETPVQREESHD